MFDLSTDESHLLLSIAYKQLVSYDVYQYRFVMIKSK